LQPRGVHRGQERKERKELESASSIWTDGGGTSKSRISFISERSPASRGPTSASDTSKQCAACKSERGGGKKRGSLTASGKVFYLRKKKPA